MTCLILCGPEESYLCPDCPWRTLMVPPSTPKIITDNDIHDDQARRQGGQDLLEVSFHLGLSKTE